MPPLLPSKAPRDSGASAPHPAAFSRAVRPQDGKQGGDLRWGEGSSRARPPEGGCCWQGPPKRLMGPPRGLYRPEESPGFSRTAQHTTFTMDERGGLVLCKGVNTQLSGMVQNTRFQIWEGARAADLRTRPE